MAEELIGSMPEALARAYQYLRRVGGGAADLATAPVRFAGRGIGQGADLIANTLASVLGAERDNPSAMADLAGLDKSAAVVKSAADDVGDINIRQPLIDALGWKNKTPVGALPQDQQLAAITPAGYPEDTGVLPVPAQRRPAINRPGGLPTAATPDAKITPAGFPEDTGGSPPAQPQIAPAGAPAVEPGLRDQFLKRLAGMSRQPTPGMSEEQKGQALMEAGLAIMSAASRPGASAMGAVGQGGMRGTAVARELEKINREQADKRRSEDRADVRTEFTLAGQDEDRALRKEDLGERSADRKQRNVNDAKRIDLLSKQVEAAGWQLKDGADGVVHAYNVRTGEDRKTPLKVKPDASQRNQQVEFYRFLMDNPQAQQLFTKSDTIDMKDEGKRRAAYGQAYLKASMAIDGDISKFPTFEEYSAKMGIGGGGGASLPPGIPPGSRQIGTSKGNPVYQTPDGKKLVVK